jgi:hypothetical protein
MKDSSLQRQEQIRREVSELRAIGWRAMQAFEEVARRYYLSPDTIRMIFYRVGKYRPTPESDA